MVRWKIGDRAEINLGDTKPRGVVKSISKYSLVLRLDFPLDLTLGTFQTWETSKTNAKRLPKVIDFDAVYTIKDGSRSK